MTTLSSDTVMSRRASSHAREAGWLLVAAFGAIVITLVVVIAGGLAGQGPTFSTTAALQQYLAPIAGRWIAVWVISTLQYVFIAAGIWFLLPNLEKGYGYIIGVISMSLALLSAILRVWECYLNIGVLANAPFTTNLTPNPTGTYLGWPGLQSTADLLLNAAVFCVALALRLSHRLPRLSIVVAVLSGLALLGNLLLVFSAGDALPPIVPTLLALPIGIALLRQGERV
jgi:hypothetical protein